MTTTAGSLALEGSIPAQDAHVAERLRAAGAMLLGEGEHERVGQHPLEPFVERLERPGRAVPESVRAGPEPVRLELRLRRGRVGQLRRGGGGHRDRRIDRLSGVGLRRGRAQADGGARQPGRDHSDLPHPGHGGPALPHRRRCGGTARRARRRRPARPGHDRFVRPRRAGLHQVPRPGRPPRRADRRGPRKVLRLQRRDRPPGGGGHRRVPARRRHRGRPGGYPARRHVRRRRARGAAVRAQGRSQRLSRRRSAPRRRCARWPT